MKTIKAWLLVDARGRALCYDYRLPIMWLRGPAKRALDRQDPEGSFVRVEIREVAPKKGKAKT